MRGFTRTALLLLACLLGVSLIAGCGGGTEPDATEATESSEATATESKTPAEAEPVTVPTDYPPAPDDVSGMQAWLEEAYPGAAWLGRITSIEYVAGEVPDSGGFSNAIVVVTDLDFGGEDDQALAREISYAIGEAHPEWAKQFVIEFADGDNILAGDIFDMTP